MLLFEVVLDDSFSAFRIEIVQILDDARFGKCHRNRIHRMMAMIISFGPVFDPSQFLPMPILLMVSHSGLLIFWPVQFLEHIRSEERRVGKDCRYQCAL